MALSIRTQAPPRGSARTRSGVTNIVVVSAVLLAFLAYRIAAMASFAAPAGSDPGNWLAFGREMFGEDVKAAAAAYPPLLPAAYWMVSHAVGPLLAGKIIGGFASIGGGIPIYLVAAAAAPRWLAFLAAALFVGAGYHSEVVAFGGYPQLLAEALTVAALWLLARGIIEHKRGRGLAAAFLAGLAVGTHHLTAVTLAAGAAVLSAALVLQGERGREVLTGLAGFVLLTGVFSLPYVPAYLTMLRELAGSPMNAQGWALSTAGDTFAYIFRNSVGVWYALVGAAFVGLLLPTGDARREVRAVTAALLLAPLLLFTLFAEVRFLQFLFGGVALGLALVGASLWELHRGRAARLAVAAVFTAAVAATTWGGIQFTRQAFPWYQIIDAPRLAALDWLSAHTPSDAVVASTAARNGWPLGWWIEGYAGRKTIIGADPRWMAFREEKVDAQNANAIFAALRSGDPGVQTLVAQAAVSYLFIDKDDPAAASPAVALFEPVFENQAVLIVKVVRRT